jgi:hypothetical protein
LDAQYAGNDISGIQISKIFWGSTDPPFMHGILATHVAFSNCYPPLIYYLTERSLFKKCPPTGKSLKKALSKEGGRGGYGSRSQRKKKPFHDSRVLKKQFHGKLDSNKII